MNNKFVIFLLLVSLGNALSAQASSSETISLKLDNKLYSTGAESDSSSTIRIGFDQIVSEKQTGSVALKLKLSHSIKQQPIQFHDESDAIKLPLAELVVSPATAPTPENAATTPLTMAPSSASTVSSPLAAENSRGNRQKLIRFVEQPEVQQNNLDFQNELVAAFGLTLAFLMLSFRWRYLTKARAFFRANLQQRASPVLKPKVVAAVSTKIMTPNIDDEAKPGILPSLQDEDNFLADFDPSRNESVSDFLASRNSVTFEQLIGWTKCRPANRQLALRLVGAPSMQM